MMKRLTYIIAWCIFLLAGCSQEDVWKENKGDLVALHYQVSLGDDISSRSSAEDAVVNKLLCVIFEGDTEVKREIVDKGSDGTFKFSPMLFGNVEYHVVFWAYYSDENNSVCFDMDDVRAIRTNDNYGSESFQANKYRDAFTNVDVIKMSESALSTNVTLYRPFAKLNIRMAATYVDEITGGTCHTTLEGCLDMYNALTKEWTGEVATLTFDSGIQIGSETEYEGIKYNDIVGEYVFANGTLTGGSIVIRNSEGGAIYGNTKLQSIPFEANKETNIYISLY